MDFEVILERNGYKVLYDERQNYGIELDNGYCTMGFDSEKDALIYGEEAVFCQRWSAYKNI